jgi:putative phage-type endonuclease
MAQLIAGEQITEATRAAWLEQRGKAVGASEVAAVMGVDPYGKSPWAVWLSKVEPESATGTDAEPGSPMWWGLADEPRILEVYTHKTGRAIVSTQAWCPHLTLPLAATLDAIDDAGNVVEVKSVGRWSDLGEEGTDEVPHHWILQAQAQLMCHPSAARVHFAVRAGHDVKLYTIEPNKDVQAQIAEEVEWFWGKVVAKEDPDMGPSDVRAFVDRTPFDPDAEPVAGGDIIHGCVELYEFYDAQIASIRSEHRAAVAPMEAMRDQAKALAVQTLGSHPIVLRDGRILRRKDTVYRERVQAGYTVTRLSFSKPEGGQS